MGTVVGGRRSTDIAYWAIRIADAVVVHAYITAPVPDR